MSCELCKLANGNIITKCYYQCDDFLIVDCLTCGPNAPMLVTIAHTMHPDYKLIDRMVAKAQELFGLRVTFRTQQRKITSHFHWHVIVK